MNGKVTAATQNQALAAVLSFIDTSSNNASGPGMARPSDDSATRVGVRVCRAAEMVVYGWCCVGLVRELGGSSRRTRIGFDSCDLVLDVVPAADLSSWSWKDRDELEWSVEQRKFSREEADAIVREGERVAAQLGSGEFPFVDDWSAWRPDESWSVPTVAAGWDDPAW